MEFEKEMPESELNSEANKNQICDDMLDMLKEILNYGLNRITEDKAKELIKKAKK